MKGWGCHLAFHLCPPVPVIEMKPPSLPRTAGGQALSEQPSSQSQRRLVPANAPPPAPITYLPRTIKPYVGQSKLTQPLGKRITPPATKMAITVDQYLQNIYNQQPRVGFRAPPP